MNRHVSPLDLALGVAGRTVGVLGAAAQGTSAISRAAGPVFDPLIQFALRVPALDRLRSQAFETLGREGAAHREALVNGLGTLVDILVPYVLSEVLRRAHVTDLVLRYVDPDAIVAAVDLDRPVARVNLDAILDRVDVDAVVAKVDLDAILDRVDVDAVVAKVDLDAILDRVDVDAIAERLDISRVLDRMDLTSLVLQRVDLDVLTQAILARVDLIGLAEQVIDGVNLSEIIRESTGTMASDTVQGVRLQGMAADEAISHAMDRFLLRHGRRSTKAPQGRPREAAVGQDAASPPGERVR